MTKEEVQHLASLARIDFSDEEIASLTKEFNDILGYVQQIENIVGEEKLEKTAGAHCNELREDGEPHEAGIYSEKLLSAAPKRDGRYIEVKKILEND